MNSVLLRGSMMKTALTICAVVVAVTSPQIVFASLLVFHTASDFIDGALVTEALAAIGFVLVAVLVVMCVAFVFINSRSPRVVAYLVRIAATWAMFNTVVLVASLTAFTGLATISAVSLLVSILVLVSSAINAWANSA